MRAGLYPDVFWRRALRDCVIDAYLVRKSDQALAVEWAEFAPAEVIDLVRALPFHSSQITDWYG